MNDRIIDIKAESLPWQFKLIGVLLFVVALAVVTNYWWLSIALAVAGSALLSWYSGTEVNATGKTFREYNSCLRIRTGTAEKYHEVEKLYINRVNVSQRIYTAHTSNSTSFQYVLYNAYLKFDGGRKIFLTSRKDKARLIKVLEPVAASLAVDLIDNTI